LEGSQTSGTLYKGIVDRLVVDYIIFSPYDDHPKVWAFKEIFWYSGWIMDGKGKVYIHLLEQVKRQYDRV
jgi:hypothetical protein